MKRKGAIVTKVISALAARTQFGQIMRRANRERGRFVVGKRGGPQVIMGICDYIKIVAPEPEILRLIGKESKRKGTNKRAIRAVAFFYKGGQISAGPAVGRMIGSRACEDTSSMESREIRSFSDFWSSPPSDRQASTVCF